MRRKYIMSKSLVLMRDVICVYHPRFRNSPEIKRFGLECPDHFNVEKLVEESLAAVGPYYFVDEDHYDFSDFTDAKTASIRLNPKKAGCNTFQGEISGVQTAGGGQKYGALRCIIYNPHKPDGGLKYYFLPPSFWKNYITIHPTSKTGKVEYTYNRVHDKIIKFQGYECVNFEELALAN